MWNRMFLIDFRWRKIVGLCSVQIFFFSSFSLHLQRWKGFTIISMYIAIYKWFGLNKVLEDSKRKISFLFEMAGCWHESLTHKHRVNVTRQTFMHMNDETEYKKKKHFGSLFFCSVAVLFSFLYLLLSFGVDVEQRHNDEKKKFKRQKKKRKKETTVLKKFH